MRAIKNYTLAAIMLMTATAATTVTAATPPAIVTQGNGAAVACASCHGVDGSGNAQAGYPALAKLPPAYFIKQIADFKSGTRSSPVMTPIAHALNAKDTESAAHYYASLASLKVKAATVDAAVIARGENLAINGAWDRQIPACFKCHAADGIGVAPLFPPIAGQHASYTVKQLQAWKTGTRTNDSQKLMQSVAKNLTADEIHAVAEYLATFGTAVSARSRIANSNTPMESDGDSKKSALSKFTPPPESAIPKNEFGDMILMGKNIFVHTQQYAKEFVGNGLDCANCHLDNGRKADSAPLWAAYVLYPAYRKKTGQVDTIESRIQGCFRYSMNGKPPALGSKEMTALVTYHYWLASGAPTGVKLPGQGFVKVSKPGKKPDIARGAEVFKNNCTTCHGVNGEGTKANGKYAFPPLWGKDSFNWGAGMHRIDTAAGFIKANMPYGRGGSLSDQEAWDVAMFMNSHERPKDPRFKGSIAQTRDKEHDENCLYGRTPEQLEVLLQKQATSSAAGKTADGQAKLAPKGLDGYSPASAH